MPQPPADTPEQTLLTLDAVNQYHDAWKTRDLQAILAMFHDAVQYHDFSLNAVMGLAELQPYILSTLPNHSHESLTHIDRIRADGHTAFIQYELKLQGATYRSSEAITVQDGKIIKIHEYGVLVSHNKVMAQSTNAASNAHRLGLGAKQLTILGQDLEQYVMSNRPFLDPELSLQDVAAATGYTRNQISYFLNNVIGQTFYNYIHECRIKHLLEISPSFSTLPNIDELAFKVGFNSLSVFYKHFRRITGSSPKAYLSTQFQN